MLSSRGASDDFVKQVLTRAPRLGVELRFGPVQTHYLQDNCRLESRSTQAVFLTGETLLPPVVIHVRNASDEEASTNLAVRFGWVQLVALYSLCAGGKASKDWGDISVDAVLDHFTVRGLPGADAQSVSNDFAVWRRTGSTTSFLRELRLLRALRFANLNAVEEVA